MKCLRPMRPMRGPVPGSPFSQPTQIVVMLRCSACKRKVAYVTSTGCLEWWRNADHHDGCGVFDFESESVKRRVAPRYREFGRTGVQQPTVDIKPQNPHSAC